MSSFSVTQVGSVVSKGHSIDPESFPIAGGLDDVIVLSKKVCSNEAPTVNMVMKMTPPGVLQISNATVMGEKTHNNQDIFYRRKLLQR